MRHTDKRTFLNRLEGLEVDPADASLAHADFAELIICIEEELELRVLPEELCGRVRFHRWHFLGKLLLLTVEGTQLEFMQTIISKYVN